MRIVLVGADSFRQHQRIRVLRDAFVKKFNAPSSALSDVTCDTAPLNEIKQALTAGDLFASKKFVVLRNLFTSSDDTQDALADWLSELSDDVICVISLELLPAKDSALKTALTQETKIETFNPFTAFEAKQFIMQQAAHWNATIEEAAAHTLANALHDNSWQLALTVKSLVFQARNTGPAVITKQLVDETIQTDDSPENFFGLTDAISAKNLPAIAKLLHAHLSNNGPVQLLTSVLFRHFTLLRLFALQPNATLPGIHEFVAKKALAGSKQFSAAQLEYVMDELLQIDADSKTGKLPDSESRLLPILTKICVNKKEAEV